MPFIGFPWVSHHVPKRPHTKNARVSPTVGGPSPCGKTGLAPCRQCIFSSFLVVSLFFHLLFLSFIFLGGGKIELKSDLQGLISRPKIKKNENKKNLCCYCCYATRLPFSKATPPFGTAAALTTVTTVTKIPSPKNVAGTFFSFFDVYQPCPNPESRIQNSRLRNPNSKNKKSKSKLQTPKIQDPR